MSEDSASRQVAVAEQSSASQERDVDLVDMDSGAGTERTDEDGPINHPFDPAKIDVMTRTMTVDLLLKRLRSGTLSLNPDFQRRAGIWKEAAQSSLIESLLLRIPLPTLYAAENGDSDWVVVDGVQRLTAIARFVYPDLVPFSDGPLKLQNLQYLKSHEGKTYDQLPGSLQTRIDETELLVHLIRNSTPEEVKFNIFTRINTGGTPLTLQELRHAMVPDPARSLLMDLAESKEFKEVTGGKIPSARMEDREMVLRFLAFRMIDPEDYSSIDLNGFLIDAMRQINKLTDGERAALAAEFRQAMFDAQEIFGRFAFRKRNLDNPQYLVPINKALFESVSVNLARSKRDMVERLVERSEVVERAFLELLQDERFMNSISVGTSDAQRVRLRFRDLHRLFEECGA